MLKKILIVEDEFDIASTMTMVLEMEGYEVRHCANGVEALDVLGLESSPDLIISDVVMPLMDGYILAKEIRINKRFDKIPLILASAAKLDESKINPKSIQGFIRKPFDLNYFLDAVRVSLLDN